MKLASPPKGEIALGVSSSTTLASPKSAAISGRVVLCRLGSACLNHSLCPYSCSQSDLFPTSEFGFNGACTYTITAFNITATATNALGSFFVTNNAGSHVAFVGVLDSTPEISRITLKDGSFNSAVSYFLMGQIGLVTGSHQPLAEMILTNFTNLTDRPVDNSHRTTLD